MITGYNHNVKYNDHIYHIQTEDSGVDNPHIITHLFVGGNIIESAKVSYGHLLAGGHIEPRVVKMMQSQHKGMLRGLIKGEYDTQIAARSVNAAHLDGPAPINVDAGQDKTSFGMPSVGASKPAAPAPPAPPAPPPPPPLPERPITEPGAFNTASSFFGDAPSPDKFIEADTLAKAFESNDESVVDSIFGEDLISEKSLDEVILSYLAEDMQK